MLIPQTKRIVKVIKKVRIDITKNRMLFRILLLTDDLLSIKNKIMEIIRNNIMAGLNIQLAGPSNGEIKSIIIASQKGKIITIRALKKIADKITYFVFISILS